MPDADYKKLVEKCRKLDLVSNVFKDGVLGVYGPIEADVRPASSRSAALVGQLLIHMHAGDHESSNHGQQTCCFIVCSC